MKTKKIQGIVGGYLEHITDAAAKVGDGFEEDVIHALRVNVKRLRAFLRCYWLFTGGARPPLPKTLKSLYRSAGEIRDLQLMLKSPGVADLPAVYRIAIEKQLVAAKENWKLIYSGKKLEKKCKALLEHDYKPLPAFMPAAFVKSKLTHASEMSAKGTSEDEDMHTIRKDIKDVIYITRLVNDRWHKAGAAVQYLPLQKFEELADLIGAFNDSRQVKALLGKIRVKGAAAADSAARRKVMVTVNRTLATQRHAVESELTEMGESSFY